MRNMLDQNDLSQISNIVIASEKRLIGYIDKRIDQVETHINQVDQRIDQSAKSVTENITKNVTSTIIEAVGEMIEQNVLPQFDGLSERMKRMEATMVTKNFLEERLTKFKDGLTDSSLWVGKKLNRLTDVLYHNGTITTEQLLHVQRGHKA